MASSYYSSYPMYNREVALPVKRESRSMSRRGSAVSHRSLSQVMPGSGSEAERGGGRGSIRRAKSEVRPVAPLSRRQSCANLSHQKRASSESGKSKKGADHGPYHMPGNDPKPYTGRELCYDQPKRHVRAACHDNFLWDHGKYMRDECGSGIVPKRFNFIGSRRIWCKTPLSMYQATIGELGRQILCREKVVPRDVKPEPPCNVAEYILPPCRGYYRRYDCLRPCEEEFTTMRQGHKTYRDRVARYWEPCLAPDQKNHLDVNQYAGHNVYLGIRMRRKNHDIPCW